MHENGYTKARGLCQMVLRKGRMPPAMLAHQAQHADAHDFFKPVTHALHKHNYIT